MKRCKKTGIYYLSEYQPYWLNGEKNPNFNKFNGGYILDLKNNEQIGINYYLKLVLQEFANCKVREYNIITVVPSSKQNVIGAGMESLAKGIANTYDNLQYIKCLNRNTSVPKKANGGIRNIENEYKTIDVVSQNEIIGKKIILMDDVTTTGTSLIATRNILLKNGASHVVCIALGKTV